MTSNRAKGTYNKNKTLKWLTNHGYEAINCELNKIVYIKGKLVATHKDLLGADIICWNNKEFILVQCKSNKASLWSAKEEFKKYNLPKFIKKQVFLWEDRAREPKITKLK